VFVDGVYAYPTSFGLASGHVLRRSQGTVLPSSVNPRWCICDVRTNLFKLRTLIFKGESYASNLKNIIKMNLIYENWR
jgi:hypothetical protein